MISVASFFWFKHWYPKRNFSGEIREENARIPLFRSSLTFQTVSRERPVMWPATAAGSVDQIAPISSPLASSSCPSIIVVDRTVDTADGLTVPRNPPISDHLIRSSFGDKKRLLASAGSPCPLGRHQSLPPVPNCYHGRSS